MCVYIHIYIYTYIYICMYVVSSLNKIRVRKAEVMSFIPHHRFLRGGGGGGGGGLRLSAALYLLETDLCPVPFPGFGSYGSVKTISPLLS